MAMHGSIHAMEPRSVRICSPACRWQTTTGYAWLMIS